MLCDTNQIASLRRGNPVSLTTDMYGNPRPTIRTIRSFNNENVVAIIGTGFNTALQLFALTTMILIERGAITATLTNLTTLFPIILVGQIIGYATLLPWMFAARSRVALAGYNAPERWKVWASWIIPFYNFIGPFRVMRDLRVRVRGASSVTLNLWWAGWLVYLAADRIYGQVDAVGTLSTSLLVVSAAAILTSYVFLVQIIREVTASFAPSSVTDPVVASA